MYGKVKVNGVEFNACCTRPDYAGGYIILCFFSVLVCKNCGETIAPWGYIKGWIFKLFFQTFWNGKVYVAASQISESEMERILRFNKN
ncbi:MAG: hypothetical protein WC601_11035 [Desulfotomaculaceae bacterium]